jgi:hypothetical protein
VTEGGILETVEIVKQLVGFVGFEFHVTLADTVAKRR